MVDTHLNLHRVTTVAEPIGPRHELESYLDQCANDDYAPSNWMKAVGFWSLVVAIGATCVAAWTLFN